MSAHQEYRISGNPDIGCPSPMDKVQNPIEVYAPERFNKFELNEKILFGTIELLYTHIT
jgi:hypothetical protein